MSRSRLWLSPPDVSSVERALLLEAFDSNWIAPVGPDLSAFEADLAGWTGVANVAALSSGTAALHLALRLVGVGPGDSVFVPTFTFVATANAVGYLGAHPVFIDSDERSWNIDTDLVATELASRARSGRLPAAVIAVDLYGQAADYEALEPLCTGYEIPLISDAAEALGARAFGRPAGSFGRVAVLSFNGNKIVTTGGGGALVSDDAALVARARHLATQAREPAVHYEHVDAGYNYRLSNLLAAVGRGQLSRLGSMISRRRGIHARYRDALGSLPGIGWQPVPEWSEPNRWLTVIRVDPVVAGTDRETLRLALDAANIEARPTWKPMHLQPLFAPGSTTDDSAAHGEGRVIGGKVAEKVFADGLCLPSGSGLTDADIDRVIDVLRAAWPSA